MKNLSNFNKMHIFFVGIGGISMSGLAKISLELGAKVSGSDMSNAYLPELSSKGAIIFLGHNKSHITRNIDLIVYSGAIKEDNEEILEGRKLGIPTIERNVFLSYISSNFLDVIAIAGCHGKTTVTAMLGHIFECANINPTIHIGGESLNFKSNTKVGDNDIFIVEGCEYRESFLSLFPTTATILNIDKDHLDYYKTFENIKSSFQKFANNSKTLFVFDDIGIVHKNIIIVNNLWAVRKIKVTKNGYKFHVYYKNKLFLKTTLNTFGIHNIYNSLMAIAIAHHYRINKKTIQKSLQTFLGVKRRGEVIGQYYGVPVIADYAHHPKEIESSIGGILDRYKNPLIIFQPHTYSRTISLMNEFLDVFNKFQDVIIYSTYPAREDYMPKGSAYSLFKKIKSKSKYYAKNMNDLNELMHICVLNNKYDVIVVLGAGDLYDKMKDIL